MNRRNILQFIVGLPWLNLLHPKKDEHRIWWATKKIELLPATITLDQFKKLANRKHIVAFGGNNYELNREKYTRMYKNNLNYKEYLIDMDNEYVHVFMEPKPKIGNRVDTLSDADYPNSSNIVKSMIRHWLSGSRYMLDGCTGWYAKHI